MQVEVKGDLYGDENITTVPTRQLPDVMSSPILPYRPSPQFSPNLNFSPPHIIRCSSNNRHPSNMSSNSSSTSSPTNPLKSHQVSKTSHVMSPSQMNYSFHVTNGATNSSHPAISSLPANSSHPATSSLPANSSHPATSSLPANSSHPANTSHPAYSSRGLESPRFVNFSQNSFQSPSLPVDYPPGMRRSPCGSPPSSPLHVNDMNLEGDHESQKSMGDHESHKSMKKRSNSISTGYSIFKYL